MIKINLNNAKSQLDLSDIAGLDLSKLKIKALVLVIFLIYLPDFVLLPMWEEEREKTNQALSLKRSELSRLKREVAKSQDLEKQIRELKAQEETLGKKLQAVKQAISEKRNPSSILLYIAKNAPAELWINELEINEEKMIIKGDALDYASIGSFVNNLRSSVFIQDANIINTSSSVSEQDKRRIETFEVHFGIARFNQ